MRNRTLWLKAVFGMTCLALVLQFARPVKASVVTISAGTAQVSAGGTVDVPVEVTGAPGIGPLHIELDYDPAVLAAVSVSRGPLLTNALMESSITASGRVVAAIVAADAIKGDGVVITIRFKAVGESGQHSALTLQGVKAWERGNGRDVEVKTQDGQVNVTSSNAWMILVAVACLVLLILVAGGVLIFYFMRKK